MRFYFLAVLLLSLCFFTQPNLLAEDSIVDSKRGILVEALLARVGREPVMLSDLIRYNEVENVMMCIELRKRYSVQATEAFNITLGRYIEEELMYQEARSKKMSSTGFLQNAIASIQKKKNCLQEWQELGKRFGGMWSTSKRPHEGESMLVRELEKRLLVDNFEQTQIKSERGLWVREQKVKIPIRLYLD